MGKKIVFFDIDGTLVDFNKKLPDSTRQALKELRENGTHVAIATGRGPLMAEHLLKELNIDCYACYNGSVCVYDGEIVYSNPISVDLCEKVTQFANANGHSVVYMGEFHYYSSKEDPFINECFNELYSPLPVVDPEFYKNKPVYQMLIFYEEKDNEKYANEITDLEIVRWHNYSVDLLPKGGSKAYGIRQMVERMGYEMKDVYAFGDGLNDLQMVTEVGTGICMGNGHPLVKEAAVYVTDDVTNDGVYKGLKHFGLI
ncbi:MAG: Cof-type family hydrolase [Bacillales bacterium]|jgi:Cof subfamily protein (haloacid dehalogenase superfamily)|nr:Cof-type family hydrolase [Bacillales bacterium]